LTLKLYEGVGKRIDERSIPNFPNNRALNLLIMVKYTSRKAQNFR
jgi:hypothetical protein